MAKINLPTGLTTILGEEMSFPDSEEEEGIYDEEDEDENFFNITEFEEYTSESETCYMVEQVPLNLQKYIRAMWFYRPNQLTHCKGIT